MTAFLSKFAREEIGTPQHPLHGLSIFSFTEILIGCLDGQFRHFSQLCYNLILDMTIELKFNIEVFSGILLVPSGFYSILKEIISSSTCDFTILNIYRCLTLSEIL